MPTVFSNGRERPIKHGAVVAFFNGLLVIADRDRWLSEKHFSVDAMLIQAWAGHRNLAREDGGDAQGDDVRGASRSNEFHVSTTRSDARLYRKGKTASELRYMAQIQIQIQNRNAFVASARWRRGRVVLPNATPPGRWGRCASIVRRQSEPDTGCVGGAQVFVEALKEMKVSLPVAQNKNGRRSVVPGCVAGG